MNRSIQRTVITTLLLGSAALAHAEGLDPDAGKALVDENCYRCHGSEVYTRKDRMVKNISGLTKQVRRCDSIIGTGWFDDEIDNAAAHLNRDFYHLKK